MIVGILSDTHGKADIAFQAVNLLLQNRAQYLIHCGDVGSTAVLDAIAGHPAMFVFGNTDHDRQSLSAYAQHLGIACGHEQGKLSLGNKLAIVTHGDDNHIISSVLQAQQVDYLFLGHTHKPLDQKTDRVRIINPGALYRAPQKTVALLNTDSDQLHFLPVPSPL